MIINFLQKTWTFTVAQDLSLFQIQMALIFSQLWIKTRSIKIHHFHHLRLSNLDLNHYHHHNQILQLHRFLLHLQNRSLLKQVLHVFNWSLFLYQGIHSKIRNSLICSLHLWQDSILLNFDYHLHLILNYEDHLNPTTIFLIS